MERKKRGKRSGEREGGVRERDVESMKEREIDEESMRIGKESKRP